MTQSVAALVGLWSGRDQPALRRAALNSDVEAWILDVEDEALTQNSGDRHYARAESR